MIGFDSLGTMGRLGNQMFQHAALKGIARHHGYQYCIPPKNPEIQKEDKSLQFMSKVFTRKGREWKMYILCPKNWLQSL